jgi:outer membrane immunogenic protein
MYRLRRIRRGWLALGAFLAATPAAAQAPAATDIGSAWTGFYVGAAFGAGGATNTLNASTPGLITTYDGAGASGVLGSVHGGFDYRITERGVIGLLGELTYSGLQGFASVHVPGASASVNMNTGLGWAVLARASVLASPSTLLYLVGGYTGQNVHGDGFTTMGGTVASFSSDQTVNGWTIGPGIETLLAGNWSAKLEYRYSQFGQTTLAGGNVALMPSNQVVRAGLSYRFGGLGVASSDAPPTPAAPINVNWTGLYAGVAGGAGVSFGKVDSGPATGSFNSASQALLGSVFAGADYQFAPSALVGVMGDIAWTGLQATLNIATPAGSTYLTATINRQWSVMGRVGWLPTPSTLIYAAAGYSEGNLFSSAASPGAFSTRTNTFGGFTVGPGIEMAVSGGWTTRLEYRFTQFEQKDFFGGVSLQPSNHTIRVGLSYKLGFGAGISGGSTTN